MTSKRTPIFTRSDHCVTLNLGRTEIDRLIPHRSPFQFLDTISSICLTDASIIGTYTAAVDNPVFDGHFPEKPVFPGVLLIESMAQLGLVLSRFLRGNTVAIDDISGSQIALFTKILSASFISPVRPGDHLTLMAKMIQMDDFLGQVDTQVWVNDRLCAFAKLEVFFE